MRCTFKDAQDRPKHFLRQLTRAMVPVLECTHGASSSLEVRPEGWARTSYDS